MTGDDKKTVRKTVFASMCGVTPARVSQWLSEGKLTSDALIGEGRRAKINVAVAVEQLKARLDASQRFGLNGLATRLSSPLAITPAQLPFETSSEADQGDTDGGAEIDNSVMKRIQEQKLRQAELQTARLEEQDRVARGIYVRAADVEAEITKIGTELLSAMEGSLHDIAAAVSGKFGIPVRDARAVLNKSFRALRERVSKDYAAMAAAEPETLEDRETYH